MKQMLWFVRIMKHLEIVQNKRKMVIYYALAICNHGFQARGREGDSRENERGFDQSFATAVRGKYPGFALCMQKGRE